MTTTSGPLLLLGGAGLPGWIWDDVREALGPSRDVRVAARPADSKATLADHADAALASVPTGRFCVVAHSAGGVVATELAGRCPDRITATLGVSAVIPQEGGSFLSAMPAPNRWILSAMMRVVGTRPPESAIRRSLADRLDDHVADRLVADFTAASPGLFRGRTVGPRWTGPRGYLHTTADRELPAAVQRRSADRLGAHWSDELPTGHLPMLEDPAALSSAILRFLDTVAPAKNH